MTTFQGYPTQFNYQSGQWVPLTEELCLIEILLLTTPPAIALTHTGRNRFLSIPLNRGFQYQLQNPTSVLVTSNQTYGFVLTDEEAGKGFMTILERLSNLPQPVNEAVNTSTLNPFMSAKVQRNPVQTPVNPFATIQPKSNRYSSQFNSQFNAQMHSQFNTMQFNRPSNPQFNPTASNSSTPPFNPQFNQQFNPQSNPPLNQQFNSVPLNQQFNPVMTLPLGGGPPVARQKSYFDEGGNAHGGYQGNNENNSYGSTDKLNDFISQHRADQSLQLTEEETWCDLLADAIEAGNIENAEEFVTNLAERKAKVSITRSSGQTSEFNLLIQVEDKDGGGDIVLAETVDPQNTTIKMLKYQIYRKYQFPLAKQRWIINKRLAKDTETLAVCGVKTTGTMVYLYLKSIDEAAKSFERAVQTDESSYEVIQRKHAQHIKIPLQNQPQPNVGGAAAQASIPVVPVLERVFVGWECGKCTLKNLPTFEGCTLCSGPRPDDYQIPPGYVMLPEELERYEKAKMNEELALHMEYQRKEMEDLAAQQNYQHMLQAMDQKLLYNQEEFECSVCFVDIEIGEGVILRDCLHQFCKECLIGTITTSDDPAVQCPHNDGFACPAVITMQEIEELLPDEEYGKYLAKSLSTAERGAKDSFHCRSANCIGWCFYEDDVNTFVCPICGKNNCLTCKAIHPDQSCQQYQDDLKNRAENDEAAQKTQQMLQELITRGEAMKCPQCDVILQKKSGCDWMRCTMCRCEICWATKGPRWGPKGNGDTTGGCKCGINGRCTPTCGNCH